MKYVTLPLLAALGLACACTPEHDMQGVDPVHYYDAHPIKNTVESHNAAYDVHFAPGQTRLSRDEIERLRAGLRYASPQATRNVELQFSDAENLNNSLNSARRRYLVKFLLNQGFPMESALAEPSASVPRGEVRIAVTYDAVVLPPHCPDWRLSPVTSYSNTWQGNFACAEEVNLGLMVADPHDLLQGTGNAAPDTERAAQILSDYHAGKDPTPPPAAAASSTSSVAAGVATGVGQ